MNDINIEICLLDDSFSHVVQWICVVISRFIKKIMIDHNVYYGSLNSNILSHIFENSMCSTHIINENR